MPKGSLGKLIREGPITSLPSETLKLNNTDLLKVIQLNIVDIDSKINAINSNMVRLSKKIDTLTDAINKSRRLNMRNHNILATTLIGTLGVVLKSPNP